MRRYKNISTYILILVVGCSVTWFTISKLEVSPGVSMAEYGGTVDYGFNAEVVWHPETKQEGSNFVIHEVTWNWVFHNRSEKPIQFSIPRQKIHIDKSVISSQFFDIPESLLIEEPITLAPNQKAQLTASSNGGRWHKAKDGDYGFRIIAKIDSTYHILGCASNVRKSPKPNK